MHLSPISEEAGGYGYGSARDDSFFGFLNGCWFVDFPLGNGKLAKVFFLPYTFAGTGTPYHWHARWWESRFWDRTN